MPFLPLMFGVIVGLSLGLTGGGGAIFAVPLLVYGMSIDASQAVGISLAAVGMTSAVGCLGRWRAGQVEIATGLMFAAAGMIGAPIGSWLSLRITEPVLLTLFALLMLVVAVRMWHNARSSRNQPARAKEPIVGPMCRRDAAGNLRMTAACLVILAVAGLLTGVLAGLFGVGGGFVIVPALVLLSGMAIHRAIGTSLLVITLISASGVASYLLSGRDIPVNTTLFFVAGGVSGMFAGIAASRYLSGPALQKVFAVAIVAVAVFVILRTTFRL